MSRVSVAAIGLSSVLVLAATTSAQQSAFSTLITTPLPIEGFTHDGASLYTIGRAGEASPCPVWQIDLGAPRLVVIGFIQNPCSPSGLVFNSSGQLFTVDADRILTLSPP
jgi:hypothetical protein